MFFIEGVLVVVGLAALSWRASALTRFAVVTLAVLAFYFATTTEVTFRDGGSAWWQDPPWRNVILFVLLLLGMMFRVVWEALERRESSLAAASRSVLPRLSGWDFVRPALVSLIVFQGVLLLAKSQDLSWELGLASFQNGFFWNTLFGRTRAVVEGSADHGPHARSVNT